MAREKLKIGVTGAGYFGRFHALKAAAGPRVVLAGVHDADPERARAVGAEAGAPALAFDALLAASDAIIVAAPADAHHALAGAALRAGRHVLVEKPIAATLAQADDLAALAVARGLVLMVGHLERFSAAFAAVSARVRQPRRIVAARSAPFKQRGTDVSVVLDLMIHDLDLVLTLMGGPPTAISAVGDRVLSGHLDRVTSRLTFPHGDAVIAASRVAPETVREMRIHTAAADFSVDFVARRLSEQVPGHPARISGWQDHDSLAAEHAAFVAAILDGAPVVVDAAAGRAALAVALAVEAAAVEAAALRSLGRSGGRQQTEQDSGGGL